MGPEPRHQRLRGLLRLVPGQDARTFDKQVFGPISVVTKEIGLKGGMLDNRVTFTLGAFQIDRQNNEFRGTPSGFSAGDVENLMNPNTITADDPRYVTSWHDVNQCRSILSTESSGGTTSPCAPARPWACRRALPSVAPM